MSTYVKKTAVQGGRAESPSSNSTVTNTGVLCVDLDGTLIKSDLLWECIAVLLKTKPFLILLIPFWLLKGRVNLKRQLALRVELKPTSLPYRTEVLDFLRTQSAAGRPLVLATASDQLLADNVARYLGIFTQVCASDGETNLKGAVKAKLLTELFGEHGFEYVGDSGSDVAVWRASAGAYVAGDDAIMRRAGRVTTVREVFRSHHASLQTWLHALRGHHWFKNALLCLPLALAHNISLNAWLKTGIGFILFGICASGLYILNDVLDLHSDRGHPWKRRRPFAAGEISIAEGLAMSVLFLAGSLMCAFILQPKFWVALCGYALLTVWYSVWIKKIVLLDAFVLSSFYSARILAGALITATPLSQWFLMFSLFFFLSLAMAKRYSELVHADELIRSGKSGRGYIGNDRELILALGVGSSFSAIVIFSLYVHGQEVGLLYRNPVPLLLLCPIFLYWMSHIWLKAHRGDLNEDPVTFALRDPVSHATGFAAVLVIALSLLGARL